MDEDLKKPAEVTPQGETPAAQGTVSDEKVDTTKVETPQIEMVPKTELEKREIRINQLENQLERVAQENDPAKYEDIIAELRAEIDARNAEKEQEESNKKLKSFEDSLSNVFDTVLEQYPEEVKVVARLNKDKLGVSPIVGDITYMFEAEQNIKGYLDGLAEGLKVISKPDITVDATNPSITPSPTEKSLVEAELAKEPADRDFKEIIAKRLGKRT